ncbi:MAG: class I SAM-dependent methyltransferase [Flavobacteriaceae bacterium]
MEEFDRKKHWEKIYETKELEERSWFQATPKASLDIFLQFDIPTHARIIDVGGGDSLLVDHLLNMGYKDITVLDISETAILKAKTRLGEKASRVKWIVADAATFKPTENYDFWHDRATFHFLTTENEISRYLETAYHHINPKGILLIGTFSEKGPKICSGIEIKQYSEYSMTSRFKEYFEKIKCFNTDHKTPSGALQNFIFCCFRKL